MCQNCNDRRIREQEEFWDRVLHPDEVRREREHARNAHKLT